MKTRAENIQQFESVKFSKSLAKLIYHFFLNLIKKHKKSPITSINDIQAIIFISFL
jgi:hypothetical protein